MPSSLARVLSSALGYSPCPPVSVSGTGAEEPVSRSFSWKRGQDPFWPKPLITSRRCAGSFNPQPPTGLNPHVQRGADRSFFVTREFCSIGGAGMFTCLPSPTPFGLNLGPDSPWADYPGPGTLGLSANGFLVRLIATYAYILTRDQSSSPFDLPSPRSRRSPTDHC